MCVTGRSIVLLLAMMAGLLVLLAISDTAAAAGAYGKYLSPDQAFKLQAKTAPGAVVLHWDIADGYYLYRDKIVVTASPAVIADTCLPPGEVEVDPYFGRTVIYRHAARVVLPRHAEATARELALDVTYQGCAEAGLCYPPSVQHMIVAVVETSGVVQTPAYGARHDEPCG